MSRFITLHEIDTVPRPIRVNVESITYYCHEYDNSKPKKPYGTRIYIINPEYGITVSESMEEITKAIDGPQKVIADDESRQQNIKDAFEIDNLYKKWNEKPGRPL